MKLECVEGEYKVLWICHASRAHRAKLWCYEQFDVGWGEVSAKGPGGSGVAHFTFTFKRLYHAQWFMLRWNNVDQ